MPEPSDPHINLLELLDGLRFPASKQDVILHAERRGGSEEALDQLQAIPDDDYKTREELLTQVTVIESPPGSENLWSSGDSDDIYSSDEDEPEPNSESRL